MAETKKKAKLSIEEKIARREEMTQKNSNWTIVKQIDTRMRRIS